MRVVLDANVLVAAFATEGFCHSLLELCLKDHPVILSDPLLEEVERALRERIGAPPGTLKEILAFLRKNGEVVDPGPLPEGVDCRDPGDRHVLALTLNHHARVLVTGDKDLSDLKSISDISILTPRQFYQLLREQ